MRRPVGSAFWIETALGIASALVAVITLAAPNWIELAFAIDLDAGSGALEWAVVAAAVMASCAMFAAARREYVRSLG